MVNVRYKIHYEPLQQLAPSRGRIELRWLDWSTSMVSCVKMASEPEQVILYFETYIVMSGSFATMINICCSCLRWAEDFRQTVSRLEKRWDTANLEHIVGNQQHCGLSRLDKWSTVGFVTWVQKGAPLITKGARIKIERKKPEAVFAPNMVENSSPRLLAWSCATSLNARRKAFDSDSLLRARSSSTYTTNTKP